MVVNNYSPPPRMIPNPIEKSGAAFSTSSSASGNSSGGNIMTKTRITATRLSELDGMRLIVPGCDEVHSTKLPSTDRGPSTGEHTTSGTTPCGNSSDRSRSVPEDTSPSNGSAKRVASVSGGSGMLEEVMDYRTYCCASAKTDCCASAKPRE